MQKPQTIRREIELELTIEEAWALVSTAAGLERWFADDVELERSPGGGIRTRTGERDERAGTIERIDEERELSFVWRGRADPPTRVIFAVSETELGTRLVVSETTLSGSPTAAAVELRGLAWRFRLEVLAGCLVRA